MLFNNFIELKTLSNYLTNGKFAVHCLQISCFCFKKNKCMEKFLAGFSIQLSKINIDYIVPLFHHFV